MGIWRTFVSRPAEVERTELYYGGPVYIAGYTPDRRGHACTRSSSRRREDRFGTSDEDATRIMLEESRAYDGPWNSIRADLEAGAHANYTWFTKHIVEAPWNRGRVVVIGDAAHSCPPTIAQGAAQGLEDALVLTELLVARDARRPRRCGTSSTRAACRARPPWSRHPSSSASGRSTATAMPTPAGLIFGIAQQMAEPA